MVVEPYGNLDWSDEGGHPNPGEAQWTWLENDLQSANEDPDIKFIACIYHTSAYSMGGHADNLVMQHACNQLFETYGVDVCLSGHNHYYARALVDDIYHVTLGSGGATQGASNLGDDHPLVTVYAEGTFFTKFIVQGDEMKAEVHEHIGDGEVSSSLIDSFTIHASDN